MATTASQFNALAIRASGSDVLHAAGCDGRGIVIGFADYGFDLLHPALCEPVPFQLGRAPQSPIKTRFSALWDQNRTSNPMAPWAHTRALPDNLLQGELSAADIDSLLAMCGPSGGRDALDQVYDPHAFYYGRYGVGREGAHGTTMATIAAGSRHAGFTGIASAATLLGVQLALPDTAWREELADGTPSWANWVEQTDGSQAGHSQAVAAWDDWRNYDAAPATVAALRYLYDRAVALNPSGIVLNVSLGTWAGAHDGASPVELEIARIAAASERGDVPPCIVVVGAGNAGQDQGHFSADVTASNPASFDWMMNSADPTQNKLEIWYRANEALDVGLEPPRGGAVPFDLAPGSTRPLVIGGRAVGVADHTLAARSGLSRVRILLHPPYFAGQFADDGKAQFNWTVRLSTRTAGHVANVHAWLERDDGIIERSILKPNTAGATLSSIASAEGALVVGGYALVEAAGSGALRMVNFPYSGQGPVAFPRSARHTYSPHLAAPAYGLWGAQSKSRTYAQTSGTSAAAAFVSGATALILQQAARAGRRLTRDDVLESLIGLPSGALAAPRAAADWDPVMGFGALAIQRARPVDQLPLGPSAPATVAVPVS